MQLHYEEFGQGQPLLILHGLFGSLDNWHSFSRRLGASFRVIAVDQRNHGRSPHATEMNYPLMAEDVLRVLQHLHLAQAFLLGHSMGGKTAMQLALLRPEVVEKLVVVDISPRGYPPRHGTIFEALLSLDLNRFSTRQEMEAALAPTIPDLAVRRFLLKGLGRDSHGKFYWKLNLRDLCENYARLSGPIAPASPFLKPALFIRGAQSDYLHEDDPPRIQQLFPRAQFRTIPQAGHWVHAEAPEPFLAAVLEFLTAPA